MLNIENNMLFMLIIIWNVKSIIKSNSLAFRMNISGIIEILNFLGFLSNFSAIATKFQRN